jgi:hypothetical protein
MNKRIRKKRVRQILLAELAARFDDSADAIQWLGSPNDELEGRTPHDAIAAGDAERVALVLDGMNRSAMAG